MNILNNKFHVIEFIFVIYKIEFLLINLLLLLCVCSTKYNPGNENSPVQKSTKSNSPSQFLRQHSTGSTSLNSLSTLSLQQVRLNDYTIF